LRVGISRAFFLFFGRVYVARIAGLPFTLVSMPSELAKKLAKIGTVDIKGVKRASSTHKPSFLFDSKAASDYDLDTIFSVGSNGFAELRGMDERMSKFEYLFSEASKEMDRVKMVSRPSRSIQG
jgi:hypothetical protein